MSEVNHGFICQRSNVCFVSSGNTWVELQAHGSLCLKWSERVSAGLGAVCKPYEWRKKVQVPPTQLL